MGQGSRVTTSVVPVSRHPPTTAAASRRARISAWAVGSPVAWRSLWRRAMTSPSRSTIAPTGTSPWASAASASSSASPMAASRSTTPDASPPRTPPGPARGGGGPTPAGPSRRSSRDDHEVCSARHAAAPAAGPPDPAGRYPRGVEEAARRTRGRVVLGAVLLALGAVLGLLGPLAPAGAQTGEGRPTVLVTSVDDPITPVIADHLADVVSTAEDEGYAAVVVEMDTPGGLDTAMRDIVQTF